MKLNFLLLLLITFSSAYSQETRYTSDGSTHLWGEFELSILETDTLFSAWYTKNYEAFDTPLADAEWKNNLADAEVEIYLGTWCGDSKAWVPRFVKLWDDLGLQRDQLKLVALYGSGNQYKQGPHGEEQGKNIHRVPTFIFKKDGQEYARIVESPQNDLVTDMAQIALGYPSSPNYRAANFLLDHFDQHTMEEMQAAIRFYLTNTYRKVSKSAELNTLGYVLLHAGEVEKALFVFRLNTYLFRFDPNVYDSYGEGLAAAGKVEEARLQYQKVLTMDPENENAQQQLLTLEE